LEQETLPEAGNWTRSRELYLEQGIGPGAENWPGAGTRPGEENWPGAGNWARNRDLARSRNWARSRELTRSRELVHEQGPGQE
jgi:hypothetical protein